MKIAIVVCIYDRFENMRRWLHAWNMCDKMGASLIFVNNTYNGLDTDFWKPYCETRGASYIQRENIGYETGIIQDIFLENLEIDNNWDVLLFFTDDTLPIKKSFLTDFMDKMLLPDVGVVCMEISGNYTPHIRTTGWAIWKDISKAVRWAYVPILDKEQCYHFEHSGGGLTLMAQVLQMDKRVVQLSNIETSPVWDTDHTNINRWEEWHRNFPNYN